MPPRCDWQQAGAAVAVNYNSSSDAAEGIVEQVSSAGGRALGAQGDVSDKAQVEGKMRFRQRSI